MSVYHWQELVEPDYNYNIKQREEETYSLSNSPAQFGFPEDAFPFEKYTVPNVIKDYIKKLLEKYLGDSTELQKYLELGIISQYLFINKYKDEAGKYIDEVKSTLQELEILRGSIPKSNNIRVKNIIVNIGSKTLEIGSWLFIATYLGNITKTLENLSRGEILTKFEYGKYEDTLDLSIKKNLYIFLVNAFEEKNEKPHGKFVFTGIFCHLFQIPISKEEIDNCIIADDKHFLDYKPFGDAIKKMINRERGQTKK
ncbi:hypothetical protein [Empedobacter brevis]|uniref:hypothetical protein n=1 Tax=Empedobacter brevis TaxID=247 RepID=UPI0028AB4035|nr:hypothetical protein [Empedobacter brevis]